MARVLCIVALLCFASCVAENAETEQGYDGLQLQQESLPWLDEFQDTQESTKRQNLKELLSKLFGVENGDILEGGADEKKREEKRRRLGTPSRRFHCRVFFWKSWNAC